MAHPVDRARCAFARADQHPLTWALMFTGTWALLTTWLIPPVYFTNDDLMFNLMSAGVGVTDAPDAHLLFTSVLIGRLLAWLYGAWPGGAWYPLYLSISLWLASSMLLYVLCLRMPAARATGLFAIYLGLFGVLLYSRLQFTIAALQCGLAGLALMHVAWRYSNWTLRRRLGLLAAAFSMLALAAAIRIHIVLWLSILAAPLALAMLAAASVRQRIGLLVIASAVLLLWAGLYQVDQASYANDPAWRDFQEFNALRSSFNDYRRVTYSEATQPIFDAVGWDRLDFQMLNEWFYADPEKYSLERLRHIVERFPAWKQGVQWKSLLNVLQPLWSEPLAILAAGFAAWAMLGVGSAREGRWIVLSMVIALIIALPLLHFVAKAPPSYLLLPSLGFIAYWAAYWSGEPGWSLPFARIWKRHLSWIGALALALAGLGNYAWAWHTARDVPRKSELLADILAAAPADRKFVIWGSSLPPDWMPAYQWDRALRDVNIIWLGASLHSPVTQRQLQRLHVDNLYRALYERDDIVLFNSKPARERLLADYVQARFGVQIQVRQLDRHDGLRLIKVESTSKLREAGAER